MPRSYVYISDRKLEGLGAEIPESTLVSIARSLKVKTPIVEMDGSNAFSSQRSRVDTLKVVTKYLRKHGLVGSIDEPEDYLEGTLEMKWNRSDLVAPSVVLFVGSTERTAFMLGGQLKHALGGTVPDRPDAEGALSEEDVAEKVDAAANGAGSRTPRRGDGWAYHVLNLADHWPAASERFEFLAERHDLSNPIAGAAAGERRALIGSPVYVARVLGGR